MNTNVADPMEELYREVILDHYRRPRHRGELASATHRLEGMNPVCGDEIYLDLNVADRRIGEIAFRGLGCSISQASASMMTERVLGRTMAEASGILRDVRTMLLEGASSVELDDLEALRGVAKFPARVKCALLCWNVLQQALDSETTTPEEANHE
jgi:nitrogen fixation protein NifU and related proteins